MPKCDQRGAAGRVWSWTKPGCHHLLGLSHSEGNGRASNPWPQNSVGSHVSSEAHSLHTGPLLFAFKYLKTIEADGEGAPFSLCCSFLGFAAFHSTRIELGQLRNRYSCFGINNWNRGGGEVLLYRIEQCSNSHHV